MNNIFEYATRNKIRFASPRGELTVEQLWDVPLRSNDGFDLNAIAKKTNETVKALNEESFVETKRTSKHVRAETALEVVKSIITTKLGEENAAKKRADKKNEEQMLLQALAEKQAGKLTEMTETQLKKRIAALRADDDEG